VDLLYRNCAGAKLRRFDYSGLKPLMANTEFSLHGAMVKQLHGKDPRARLWIRDAGGEVTMRGEAIFEEA
jgi:hydroxyacyl-ACP dehydratase HTD2-like protein with hotdog domain